MVDTTSIEDIDCTCGIDVMVTAINVLEFWIQL